MSEAKRFLLLVGLSCLVCLVCFASLGANFASKVSYTVIIFVLRSGQT